jgi:hypothetical protein
MVFIREVYFVIYLFVAIIQIPSTEYFFIGFYKTFYNVRYKFHGIKYMCDSL